MGKQIASERLLIKEVTKKAQDAREAARGQSIGLLIKFVRKQLGMTQSVLARRSGMPQSTISRVERGQRDVSISTLQRILQALSCQLVLTPMLEKTVDEIRYEQARKVAEKHVRYVQGTMNLENQEPGHQFIQEVLKVEIEKLLNGPDHRLWEDE